jgi:hypothetical protein
MIQVPASLEETTLGDVLGHLGRARATGALYLVETGSPRAGRTHRIHLRDGSPVVVASDGARIGQLLGDCGLAREEDVVRAAALQRIGDKRLFGELLIGGAAQSAELLERCVQAQTRMRLEPLFALPGARLTFIALDRDTRLEGAFGRAARVSPPLPARHYLHGRERRRGRGGFVPSRPSATDEQLLGVAATNSSEELRRAFRRRAFDLHPDRARDAADREVRNRELARVTAAYHRLSSKLPG